MSQTGLRPDGFPDPAPRSYPVWVELQRRSDKGAASAPERTDLSEIEDWLVGDATGIDDLLPLYESFLWRLVAADIPLDRASLHVGTLHPQVFGFAWNWNRMDGLCDEVRVSEASIRSDAYLRNPLYRVIDLGETVRYDLADAGAAERHPILADLAKQGFTDYIAMPLRTGGAYHNAATLATKRGGGFPPETLEAVRRLMRLFALHVERHILLRIARTVLDTYVGAYAGSEVLAGSIKRGSGERIHAILWASDLRGFTDLADRLEGEQVTAVLNAYFERLVAAVLSEGGEVLKFIGDGLLAVFPYEKFASEREAARASLTAARGALRSLRALNDAPPAELAEIDGWKPLRTGIALHDGEVFFGNVGAPERLDFTVIGSAVNTASRVEGLSKEIGRTLLITEPVARLLDEPLERLGEHRLRGLARPIAIYSTSD